MKKYPFTNVFADGQNLEKVLDKETFGRLIYRITTIAKGHFQAALAAGII